MEHMAIFPEPRKQQKKNEVFSPAKKGISPGRFVETYQNWYVSKFLDLFKVTLCFIPWYSTIFHHHLGEYLYLFATTLTNLST